MASAAAANIVHFMFQARLLAPLSIDSSIQLSYSSMSDYPVFHFTSTACCWRSTLQPDYVQRVLFNTSIIVMRRA